MTDRASHARDFAKNLALKAAYRVQQAADPQRATESKSGHGCSALDRRRGKHLHFRMAKTPERSSLGDVLRTLKSWPEPPA